VPRVPTVTSELAGAVRRGKREGRLGAEHGLDVARARLLVAMLVDDATPRSAMAEAASDLPPAESGDGLDDARELVADDEE